MSNDTVDPVQPGVDNGGGDTRMGVEGKIIYSRDSDFDGLIIDSVDKVENFLKL